MVYRHQPLEALGLIGSKETAWSSVRGIHRRQAMWSQSSHEVVAWWLCHTIVIVKPDKSQGQGTVI